MEPTKRGVIDRVGGATGPIDRILHGPIDRWARFTLPTVALKPVENSCGENCRCKDKGTNGRRSAR